MLFSVELLIFAGILFVFWYRKRVWGYPANFPPGPRFPLPFMGDAIALGLDIPVGLAKLHKKHGDIVGFMLAHHPAISIADFDTLQKTMAMDEYSHRSPSPGFELYRREGEIPDIGSGIVLGHGEAWKKVHRFTLRTLRDFGFGRMSAENNIQEEATEFLDKLEKQGRQPVDIIKFAYVPIVNSLWTIIQGERLDPTNPTYDKILEAWHIAFNEFGSNIGQQAVTSIPLMKLMQFLGVLHFQDVFKLFFSYLDPVIDKHEATLDKNGEARDFIDRYLLEVQDNSTPENREESRVQLKNSLFDMFAGGHDTTGNFVAWATIFMANNPDIQAKVQEELDRVCGSRNPETSDRPNLPYTEATIMEIMRIRTILPLSIIHMTSKEVTLNGYTLPKGTPVVNHIQAIHENEKVFPNPEKFDPNRFIKDDGQFQPHPHIIPFGIGKRRCVGEALAKVSVFVYFTRLVQRFKIKSPDGKKIPDEIVYGLTSAPKPFTVVLEPRN